MVPNSPIHPDAAMGGDSRDSSPTKGNRTPGRKLSPPKHLEAPIVEVTENESSEEKSRRASEDKTNEGDQEVLIFYTKVTDIFRVIILSFLTNEIFSI